MNSNPWRRIQLHLLCALLLLVAVLSSQLNAQIKSSTSSADFKSADEKLKFVVIVTRHGVRSPTGKSDQLNQYSRQPWPSWSVPPGYLTAHGYQLMKLFGAYDREFLVAQGLLAPSSCADAAHVRIVADSDQRTRETGKALAEGLAPGCKIELTALPEGTNDPIFHTRPDSFGDADKLEGLAALSGRISANPHALAEAYRPQLVALETVLNACPSGTDCDTQNQTAPTSLFDVPVALAVGKSDHLVEFRSPLAVASSMTENFLLEYTEGLDAAQVGWGHLDLPTLKALLQIHTANSDITQRTQFIARTQSKQMLTHVLASLKQATTSKPIPDSLARPGDRLLILSGHDTNISNISGALGLNWIIDGRRDDTPPGGALVFELWQSTKSGAYSVRLFYTAQTLDQMRNATPLHLATPPERVAVFIPACSRSDNSCPWTGFEQALRNTTHVENPR